MDHHVNKTIYLRVHLHADRWIDRSYVHVLRQACAHIRVDLLKQYTQKSKHCFFNRRAWAWVLPWDVVLAKVVEWTYQRFGHWTIPNCNCCNCGLYSSQVQDRQQHGNQQPEQKQFVAHFSEGLPTVTTTSTPPTTTRRSATTLDFP